MESLARPRIRQEQRTDKDVRIEDAAQLCALEEGIQNLRCESPSFGLASDLIEYLLERRVFPGSEFTKPKAQQGLNLPLFFGRVAS